MARQAGVITVAQAVDCGLSAASVHRRARDGTWVRLHPGVYLVGGHRLGDEARVRAAWLWAGGRAAVTGRAAAYWHGMLDRAPAIVELTVPARSKPRPQPGIRLRRRDLAWLDLVEVRHIRLAQKPLAASETALQLENGSTFLDRALQRHVRFPAFYRACCRHVGRLGARPSLRPVPHRSGVSGSATGDRGRRLGLARRRGALPQRPPQGQRDHPCRLGPAQVHLARPERPPSRNNHRDPGDAVPIHDRRKRDVRCTCAAQVPQLAIRPRGGRPTSPGAWRWASGRSSPSRASRMPR